MDVIKVPEGENREDRREIFEEKKGLELFLIIECMKLHLPKSQ